MQRPPQLSELCANTDFAHLFKEICLGTFLRLVRLLATLYIFAQVRIIGTLVPFV